MNDPLLDLESNAEDHNARHHGVLGKWEDAVRAVAIGVVQRGDKLPPEVALAANAGTIFDLREEGGSDDDPGADAIDEVKCPSPTTVRCPPRSAADAWNSGRQCGSVSDCI